MAYGKLLVGLVFLLGWSTRLVVLALLFMAINFCFAKGAGFRVTGNSVTLYTLIASVLIFSRSGLTLGLDGL